MAPKKKPENELKDQRIPIMMTEAEVKAIDDWSFENRIRSRGEAIRRLCKIGQAIDAELEQLWRNTVRIDLIATDFSKRLEHVSENSRTPQRASERVAEIAEAYAKRLFDDTGDLMVTTDKIVRQVAAYKTPGSLEDAAAEAYARLAEIAEIEQRLKTSREKERTAAERVKALNVEELGKAVLSAVATSDEQREAEAVAETVTAWLRNQREREREVSEERARITAVRAARRLKE